MSKCLHSIYYVTLIFKGLVFFIKKISKSKKELPQEVSPKIARVFTIYRNRERLDVKRIEERILITHIRIVAVIEGEFLMLGG